MSCCGQKRAALSESLTHRQTVSTLNTGPVPVHAAASPQRLLRLVYEYIGPTTLTVTSPDTGRRYRFERTGARLEIDSCDRPLMAAIPQLRQVF